MSEFYESFSLYETEYGIELTVKDTERADEFDDFIVETYTMESGHIKPVTDGMIFIFSSISSEEIKALIERFRQAVPMERASS